MRIEPVVSIRILQESDSIDIKLRPGFTREELDVVRGLPDRRYDAGRRVWSVPRARTAIAALAEAFGPDGVRMTEEEPGPHDDLLERVRIALTVRGYSPPTRKVYLGHLRVSSCGAAEAVHDSRRIRRPRAKATSWSSSSGGGSRRAIRTRSSARSASCASRCSANRSWR